MNIALAFHAGDKDQAARWIKWVEELGGIGRHRLFIMPAKGQVADFKTTVPFTVVPDSSGIQTDWSTNNGPVRDAAGANSMIRQFCWYFYTENIGAWMFMEPDAIPLREGWIDAIETEYNANRKHFMGALVPGIAEQYPDHMTGVGVYSQRTVEMSRLMTLPSYTTIAGRRIELAFDVAAAPDLLRHFHATKLIQHVFRGPKFKTRDDLRRVSNDAVLFHTDKDGGLIDLLRVEMGVVTTIQKCADEDRRAPAPETTTIPNYGIPNYGIVYSYYKKIDGSDYKATEWLLAKWADSWRKNGWTPVVIGEETAASHRDFESFKRRVEAFPSINPREYETACWLRWMAMIQVGGGLMVDYDVLPYDWRPEDCPAPSGRYPSILTDRNPVPCAVIGTALQYSAMANLMVDGTVNAVTMERGQPHVSDQHFIQKIADRLNVIEICQQYGKDESWSAKMVHYSGGACQGRPRSDVIPSAEQIRESQASSKPVTKVRSVMDEIRERLEWVNTNAKGITRHHVHRELKRLKLLPK